MYTATCELQSSPFFSSLLDMDYIRRLQGVRQSGRTVRKSQASNDGSSCGDQTSFWNPVLHELLARDDQNPPRCDRYRALELQNEQGRSL